MNEEIDFEFDILEVFEENNQLRVITECKYGKDNIGLNINKKYINPQTEGPRYLEEVEKLLTAKYGTKNKTKINIEVAEKFKKRIIKKQSIKENIINNEEQPIN